MDTDEIENEFNMSKIVVPEDNSEREQKITSLIDRMYHVETESELSTNIKEKVELWKLILLNVAIYTAFYYFLFFYNYPINNSITSYFTKCCKEMYNSTKCSADGLCFSLLSKWTEIFYNKTGKNLVEKCCYWISPYTNTSYLPFCEKSCLIEI